MEIADLITPRSVVAQLRATNKKQALQELAKRAAALTGTPERAIYDVLIERERLGTTGIGAGQPMSVDDEVRVRTEKLMEDKKVPYAKALKQVLASDTQLARRYHAAHRRQASENTGTEAAAGITA